MIFALVVIVGDIAQYEKDITDVTKSTPQNVKEENKWKNGEKIMLIVAIYIGVILIFVKTIIVAKIARSQILENGQMVTGSNATPPPTQSPRHQSNKFGVSNYRADRIYDL